MSAACGHAGRADEMGLNFTSLDPTGLSKYQAVEYKFCEDCGGRFLRAHQEMRKLKDGTRIDPMKYCSTCEGKRAKQAAESAEEDLRIMSDPGYAKLPRGEESSPKERSERAKQERRMVVECVRKTAFGSRALAEEIARNSRQRHRGKSPCQAYRCVAKVDPVKFPDRAKPHWHIGGKPDRKL